MAKTKKQINKETITIPKLSFIGIMCIIPLIGILLSKGRVGTLMVLFIGVGAGIIIGKGFFEK
ncbi:hypothetical protein HOE04_03320 [archaeon]|jgi:hypothetical protein|nr:hypothetical protein [archaeon]